jgi:hypothetical protein
VAIAVFNNQIVALAIAKWYEYNISTFHEFGDNKCLRTLTYLLAAKRGFWDWFRKRH